MRLTWSVLHSRSERAATSSERRQPDGWGSGKILLLMEFFRLGALPDFALPENTRFQRLEFTSPLNGEEAEKLLIPALLVGPADRHFALIRVEATIKT